MAGAIFPDVSGGLASGGHGEDWRDMSRSFVPDRIPEEEEEEEEREQFLMKSWAGQAKHPHEHPVNPDRTRSLSLEGDVPSSFLIRSSALEDLTTVGQRMEEIQEVSLSTELPSKLSESSQKERLMSGGLCSANDSSSEDTNCEYDQGATPKQDRILTSSTLPSQEDPSASSGEEDQSQWSVYHPEHSDPVKNLAWCPNPSSGSPPRKSRVPVSHFKGLCCLV